MFDQALAVARAYFIAHHEFLSAIAKENPGIPILEDDGERDIPAHVIADLRKSKRVFALNGYPDIRFTTWIPEASQAQVGKDFPVNPAGEHMVQKVILRREGLCFFGQGGRFFEQGGRFAISAHWWPDLWAAMPPHLLLDGREACLAWRVFSAMQTELEAHMVVLTAKLNPGILRSVRDSRPHLLDHPALQAAIAQAFKQRRLDTSHELLPRKDEITPDIYELYHAVYCFMNQGDNLKTAIWKAVDRFRDLVPSDWGDPEEALKKRVQRIDKIPSITLRETNPRK